MSNEEAEDDPEEIRKKRLKEARRHSLVADDLEKLHDQKEEEKQQQ